MRKSYRERREKNREKQVEKKRNKENREREKIIEKEKEGGIQQKKSCSRTFWVSVCLFVYKYIFCLFVCGYISFCVCGCVYVFDCVSVNTLML